jgi:transcriptional regulator with XRE-family HTH domain
MAERICEAKRREFANTLADNLPVFRAKLGISQKELADRVGISRNMLTYIEGKKKEMSWVSFVALSFMFLRNKQTEPILKSLNIYTKELEDFLMFNNEAEEKKNF